MAQGARMAVTLALALVPLGVAVGAEPQHGWKTYRNQRFGFQLQYPKDVFKPGKPPQDGAGLDFVAKDGADILAQASFNVDTGVTPQSYRAELRGAGQVTRDEGEGNWFLLVRSEPGKVTYDKVIFTCGNQLLNEVLISYPADKSAVYEPTAARIAESFKPGKGEDGPGDCADPTR